MSALSIIADSMRELEGHPKPRFYWIEILGPRGWAPVCDGLAYRRFDTIDDALADPICKRYSVRVRSA